MKEDLEVDEPDSRHLRVSRRRGKKRRNKF